MIPGDQASATVSIAVAPAEAFEIFTRQIDSWWRRGPRYRNIAFDRGFIRMEPGVGGRVFESFDERVVEVGKTTVWDPPHRMVFEWRNSTFAPAEKTEVEVRFEASGAGTRVTVVHRGWSQLRPDHPARHGMAASEFARSLGMWWGDQLTALREHAGERTKA
jgi:uncharacterized protein YndB with AHSA1/START domain